MVKLELKMQDSIGKLLDQIFQKAKVKLIMSLGNAIRMPMDILDRNAQLNQFSLFIRTGLRRLIFYRHLSNKQAKET